MQYSLDQYTLIAKNISDIEHRGDISILDENEKSRVFVSPMTCILNKNNFDTFLQSQFIPIYPIWHDESAEYRLNLSAEKDCWVALSLNEFFNSFCVYDKELISVDKQYRVLIDCADGHMSKIFELVKDAKSRYKNLEVMIGNIENPETYVECCKAGVDYVRVGVGGGRGCLTSVKLGFHASMGWLLTEIQKIRTSEEWEYTEAPEGWIYTKVVADGGISNSARMIKCLALGADYVMCGSLFAGTEEACSDISRGLEGNVKRYYGQASEKGQQDRFGHVKGHIEGTETWIPIKWTLDSLAKELNDCFSSALSYGGARNWNEFIGKVQWDIQSNSEFKDYDKK